jgi:hypothetical protein
VGGGARLNVMTEKIRVFLTYYRRKIRLIEGNVKCRHLKNLYKKGDLRLVLICPRPRNPYPLLTHFMYCILVHVYSILIHTGKGGGERVEPERMGEGQQITKIG